MAANIAGSIIAIPVGDDWGFAKVIFASDYVADAILLKLFRTRHPTPGAVPPESLKGEFDLYYTSREPLRKQRWKVVGSEAVSDEERTFTKRTSGGEVWLEDTHLGPASEQDLKSLPKMLIHGFKLIEKYAGRN